MGCSVNGPGEVADADYGYVGQDPRHHLLYRAATRDPPGCQKRGVWRPLIALESRRNGPLGRPLMVTSRRCL